MPAEDLEDLTKAKGYHLFGTPFLFKDTRNIKTGYRKKNVMPHVISANSSNFNALFVISTKTINNEKTNLYPVRIDNNPDGIM